MRFGREVDDGTGLVLCQQAFEQGGVANVALHEYVAGVALHAGQVVQIACVGEFVEVDHGLVGVGNPVEHEVGANEAGAASYQNHRMGSVDTPAGEAGDYPIHGPRPVTGFEPGCATRHRQTHRFLGTRP